MAAASASRSPTPIDSAEMNGTDVKSEESKVTLEEWDAIDRVIKGAYNHRVTESVCY